jgi:adenosine deaminase
LVSASFIAGLPKAELHMHLEGSLEPALLFALARRNGVSLPYADEAGLRAAYAFGSLQDFLDLYYQGAAALRTQADFQALAAAYFARAAAETVRHAEVFFDPQTHLSRGVAMATVVEGILAAMDEAKARLGLSSRLILCFLRHLSEDDALATLEAAEPWLGRIVGVGLDSSELGHPPEKFARVFAAAGALGLKRVAHAGEEGPAAYVETALDVLQVDRIDHGNRAMDDPRLIARLARSGVPLTLCPLSNLRLRVIDSMASQPAGAMLRAGIVATLNSDDPAYFGGYVNANYAAMAPFLSQAEMVQLARNSFTASFLPAAEIAAHLAAVDAYAAAHASG